MGEIKLKDIFQNNLVKGKLVLPDFQRDYVWKDEQQKNLLASILVKLPIGNLLFIQGSNEDFAVKQIAFKGKVDNSIIDKECEYLLDGQQRVTTLLDFFYDFYKSPTEWKNNNVRLYHHLRKRWYLKFDTKESHAVFGYDNLRFKDLSSFEPSDVLCALTSFKINSSSFSKEKDIFHPEFCLKDSLGEELKDGNFKIALAKKLADENMIPLYCIFDDREKQNNSLLTKVVKNIAYNRAECLKEICKNDPLKTIELLSVVDEDIAKHLGDEDQIKENWMTLYTQWALDVRTYLFGLLDFEMTTIVLPSDEISRAIAIFESVNEGGTKLSNFDLIVAKSARDSAYDLSLTDRISEVLKKSVSIPASFNLQIDENFYPEAFKIYDDNGLTNVFKENFLNFLSIYYYSVKNKEDIKIDLIKQKKILSLTTEAINTSIEVVVTALLRAYAFLNYRCGVLSIEDIPYKLMVLPIAKLLMEDSNWNDQFVINRLEYYYLVSIFGGAYRERQNQVCIDDLENIESLKTDTSKFVIYEERVLNVQLYSDKNILLLKEKEEVPTSIQKSIYQFVISQQPKDFFSNNQLKAWEISRKEPLTFDKTNEDMDVELHHIIPLGDANNIKQSAKNIRKDKKNILNSPMNKTYISKFSNRKISDLSPSKYFEFIDDYQLVSHLIPTETNNLVRTKKDVDLYEAFIDTRYNCFCNTVKTRINTLKN